jgi:hypothetical protein
MKIGRMLRAAPFAASIVGCSVYEGGGSAPGTTGLTSSTGQADTADTAVDAPTSTTGSVDATDSTGSTGTADSSPAGCVDLANAYSACQPNDDVLAGCTCLWDSGTPACHAALDMTLACLATLTCDGLADTTACGGLSAVMSACDVPDGIASMINHSIKCNQSSLASAIRVLGAHMQFFGAATPVCQGLLEACGFCSGQASCSDDILPCIQECMGSLIDADCYAAYQCGRD